MLRKTRPGNTSSNRAVHRNNLYARAVLAKSAHILVSTGHSPKELLEEFREICSTIHEPSPLPG